MKLHLQNITDNRCIGWAPDHNAFFCLNGLNVSTRTVAEIPEEDLARFCISQKLAMPKPIDVCWHITNSCNLKCLFCLDRDDVPQIRADDRRFLLQRLLESSLIRISFSGGEPLLLKETLDMMAVVKAAGIGTVLVTNGLLLNCFLDRLEDSADWVIVSLDGTKEIHDNVRGHCGAFDIIVENIRQLIARDIRVRINTVVSEVNLSNLDDIVNLGKGIGVPRMALYEFMPIGRGYTNRSCFEISHQVFIESAMALKTRYDTSYFKIDIRSSKQFSVDRTIYQDGSVYHFPWHGSGSLVGNLRVQSFQEIWDKDPYPKEYYFPGFALEQDGSSTQITANSH